MKNKWMTQTAISFDTPADGGGGTAVAPAPAAPAVSAPAAPAAAPSRKGMFDRVMPASLKRLPGGSEDPARKATPAAAPTAKPTAAAPAAEAFNVTDDAGKVVQSFKTQAEADAWVKAQNGEVAPAVVDPAAGENTFNVMADDNKTVLGSFKTEAEAQAFMDAQTNASPAAADDALPRPFMGRFKTLSESETAYRRTEVEASRLFHENKTLKESHTKALADRETEVAALKVEIEHIRATPAIRELSKEELTQLWKDDPAAAGEYLTDKKLRERDAVTAKAAAADQVRAKQERLKQANQRIEARRAAMQKDAENFPQFEDLAPNVRDILKITEDERGETPLRGHEWAEELAYLAAYGRAAILAEKNTKAALHAATKKVYRIAAAGAAMTSGPARGGAGQGSGGLRTPTTESKGARIVKAAPKNRFFGGGRTQS